MRYEFAVVGKRGWLTHATSCSDSQHYCASERTPFLHRIQWNSDAMTFRWKPVVKYPACRALAQPSRHGIPVRP